MLIDSEQIILYQGKKAVLQRYLSLEVLGAGCMKYRIKDFDSGVFLAFLSESEKNLLLTESKYQEQGKV